MRVIRTLAEASALTAGRMSAFTFGVFDGVHLGHQDLIGRVVAWARAHSGLAAVMTFEQHPLRLLAPSYAPPMLTGVDRKLALFGELGVDLAAVIPFTSDFAATGPDDFLREIVAGAFRARAVFMGFNNRFGRGGTGTTAMLRQRGHELGFSVDVVEPHLWKDTLVSSTQIREHLREGEVRSAAALLGRPHLLEGAVVEGDRRGRTMGYPTANLAVPPDMVMPCTGVYAVRAEIGARSLGGMLNIGHRPTFEPGALSVEAHLFDFEGDLYGRRVGLEMIERLRDERRFGSADELVDQLRADEQQARTLLGTS